MKKYFTIIFLISSICFSQNIKITSIKKVEIDQYSSAFYPQFSKDDENIIFTSENYKGLFLHNLKSNQTKIISDENGVGYKPLIIDNENIVIRNYKFDNGKKKYSVISKNIISNLDEILEVDKRQISIPNQVITSEILLLEKSSLNKKVLQSKKLLKSNMVAKAIYSQNDKLYLVQNDDIIDISPLGKGVYVWESLSNDGEKILFTFGNQGSFVCDLEGNILLNIKDAHYPKFSPDDKFILFMKDKDDGHKYISSDLFIYSIDENKEYQITNSENMIEMFADWSNDQTSIVYNTIFGEIYLAKISFEN